MGPKETSHDGADGYPERETSGWNWMCSLFTDAPRPRGSLLVVHIKCNDMRNCLLILAFQVLEGSMGMGLKHRVEPLHKAPAP